MNLDIAVDEWPLPSDTPNLHAARMLQEEDPSEPSTRPSHSGKWFGGGALRDPVERRQAALVQVILVGLIVAALLWIPLPLSMSGLMIGRLLGSSGALLVVLFTSIAVIVLRRGHMQRAILLANTGLLIGLALVLVAWGLSTGLFMVVVFALPVVLAGLLASRRGLLFTIVLSVSIVLSIALLEHRSSPLAGISPLQGEPTRIIVGTFAIVIVLLGLFLDRFGAALRDALSAALAREAELEQTHVSLEARSAQLLQMNRELEHEIAERKALEARLLQSQKMESIGRLAGGVAHDFNNLLTAISGYSSLALESLPPNSLVSSDLAEIQKAARSATSLTRQLLAFARKQIIEPRVLDLNDLMLELENLLRRLISEHIELVISTAADLWPVKADPGQIEQVLVNLAVNARDAMPDGGRLIIETANVVVDGTKAFQHANVAPGAYVMLMVSDTGIGMTPEVQAHLFEPFFTTKEPGEGTGLGLATCYGIIAQHNGYISVASKLGHGTTVSIYLPRVEAPVEPRAPHDDMQNQSPGSETLLLVEDQPAVRELAARVLREQGYTVLEAIGGVEALALLQQHGEMRPDLVLTDMVMPRMSGQVLVEQLLAVYPTVKVLFMSGYTDASIIHHEDLPAGVAFLQKPFTPTALIDMVRQVLDT